LAAEVLLEAWRFGEGEGERLWSLPDDVLSSFAPGGSLVLRPRRPRRRRFFAPVSLLLSAVAAEEEAEDEADSRLAPLSIEVDG
jgi:hypothetical protein